MNADQANTPGTPSVGDLPHGRIVASTYVRRTVQRATDLIRKPGDDPLSWEVTLLLGVIANLDYRGHGDEIRAAADALADLYDVPAQSEVEKQTEASAVSA